MSELCVDDGKYVRRTVWFCCEERRERRRVVVVVVVIVVCGYRFRSGEVEDK